MNQTSEAFDPGDIFMKVGRGRSISKCRRNDEWVLQADNAKAGHYTEADRQMWIDPWSQPGSTTAGLTYYRAYHRNPPYNETHPASTVAHSRPTKEVT